MGSNFTRFLVNNYNDIKILVYDKLTYAGRIENLKGVMDKITFVRGDVANEEFLEYIVRTFQPSVIVNFAAETHVDRSINEPASFMRTNIYGVFSLLEVIRRVEVPLYVHISTDEVYGDLAGIDAYADECWPLNPSSPYSASKASGDLLIKAYGRTYGVRYRIVRPCNNYGPYQHPEKLIPRTIVRILHGMPATIYGDGMQVRDWLYVEDFCRALALIIEKGGDYEVYNVCANQFATVKRIVERIVELMGRDPSKDVIHVSSRPGEDRRYAMKCEKLRGLGWRPLVGLEEGLARTIRWYLDNEWWWKPLVDETYVLADEPWGTRK